jgi:hypothetical protein
MTRIWVSRANDKKNTIICAARTFDEADEAGKKFAEENDTTFYIREYVELWSLDAIMDEATEARIKMNLLLERIVDAMKTT